MTPQESLATVFSFRTLVGGEFHVAPYKATRESIQQIHHGDVLEGTGQSVDVEALDAQGRYRRVATGWGDLR